MVPSIFQEANERKVKEQMENREAKREAAFVEKYKDVMVSH